MNLKLTAAKTTLPAVTEALVISGSKSESNRLLVLQALFPKIIIKNLSDSDDTKVLQNALSGKEEVIDVYHAGTAMRFLTTFFAVQNGKQVVLTGSERMKQRPVKPLVEALRRLGAHIEYMENEGFPPLKITGTEITKYKVSLDAGVSSQFVTALLLVAPSLKNGLEITLQGSVTSFPYIKMTLAVLEALGVQWSFSGNKIAVRHFSENQKSKTFVVESDWSSASYFYGFVALGKTGTQITLKNYKKKSLQGDAAVVEIYKKFGVETVFADNAIQIIKSENRKPETLSLNLADTPDIAQTIAVTCFGLGAGCHLTGLHTLKIKETDRLEALKTELEKLGAKIILTADSLFLEQRTLPLASKTGFKIKTYNDHRMAMAFAPLSLLTPLVIEDAGVVSKSYPDFWKDIQRIGIELVSC